MKQDGKVSKIAFVSTMGGVAWGGSEELWSQTALRLRGLGHAVSASVYGWNPRVRQVLEMESAGALVSYRPLKLVFPHSTIEKIRQRFSPSPLDHDSMAWLENEKPDLLVISQGGPWDGVPWMTACRQLEIPYCPIVHAHSEIWWPTDEELQEGRPALSDARRLFFVSKANRTLMENQCGRRFDHAEVVINPWNGDARRSAPWPVEDGLTKIACIGRMDPRAKGQDVLLQVMALPKWRDRQLHLNFYGGGPCEESMKALAKLLELEDVSFHGQIPDTGSVWAENHALVLPSRYEGLPLVIVEAMFSGRVVITTDVAGNAELLRDGATGFIAAAPTVALLDEAMERAWSRRADWREMGAAARQDVSDAIPADPIGLFAERLLSLLN